MTRTRIAGALLLIVLLLQAVSIVRRADREPHPDETEFLHATWLMSHGEHLYTSFFEHHPPFLFAALRLVESDDVAAFLVRARLLSGAFAMIALCAFAAIVWRIEPVAAAIALAILLASGPMWTDGLTAIRAEPFALAFFWCGAALALLSRGSERTIAIAGGVGIGLVAIAALWNPKWPFSSLVVAGFWIARTRMRLLGIAVAAAVIAVAMLVLRTLAPFDQLWFFVVEVNRANYRWLSTASVWKSQSPFTLAPVLLPPVAVVIAAIVVAAAFRKKHIALFFLLLTCAAALELRTMYPWPVLWNYYFLLWGFAGGTLVALVPAAVAAMLPAKFRWAGGAAYVVLAIVIAANLIALAPFESRGRGPYYGSLRYFASHLRSTDTVWIDLRRHPVAVRDVAYDWFGNFPAVDAVRRTPRGARYLPPRATPFCAAMRGAPSTLRFVSNPHLLNAPPSEQRCFQQLLAANRVRPTPVANVFELTR